ncbi:MAG: hypothetical protein KJ964_05520 [Verrucomicrobia bacterium]|nr:hypothetical protein [Verrucomicrobiota bacterium]MBU1856360.1 hypothetical protein [Verrucomicrobiota bacterium]
MKKTCIIAVILLSINFCCGFSVYGEQAPNKGIKKSGVEKITDKINAKNAPGLEIFPLDKIRTPGNSIQYFYLPVPGGENLQNIRNFKYVIELPEGYDLAEQLHFTGAGSFTRPQLAYPRVTKKTLDNKRSECELSVPGIGSTYVALWISTGCGYAQCAALTGTSGNWEEFDSEYTAPPLLENPMFSASVWVLRWTNHPENRQARLSHKSRGIVDVDDLVIREKKTGKIVFEENFNSGFNSFTNGQKNNVKMEEENGNKFVRFTTDDANAEKQQSIATGFKITPGEEYQITCKARVSVSVMPDNLAFIPLWIKTGKAAKEAAEIKAHYEYDIDGKHVRSPEDTLRVIIDDTNARPSALETVLWSAAENSMNTQDERMQDYLVRLTRVCGIKTHLTSLGLNPWQPPFYGNLEGVNLRNRLCEKVRQHGMTAMPYLAFPYRNMGFDAYASNHPPAPGKLAFNEYINQFGQTNKASNIYNKCPTRLCDERDDYWQGILKFLQEAAELNKWGGLMWDFEQSNILPIGNSECSCFCAECVEGFKKFSGIQDFSKAPEKRVMLLEGYSFDKLAEPAKSIYMHYPLEWMKFRADQNARMWHSFMGAVKKANPDALFYLYSGTYQDQNLKKGPWHSCERYGVNMPTAGKYDVDLFLEHGYSMLGKRGVEIKLAKEAINTNSRKKIGVLNTVGSHFAGDAVFTLAKNQAIQSVAQAEAGGFQIYRWDDFDSQIWMQIREAMMALTRFEDFLTKGLRFDALSQINNNKLEHSVWLKGEDKVIFVYNNTANDEKVTVKTDCGVNYAACRFSAQNYYTGEKYNDPANISCVVPKWDTAVIHIQAY